MLRCPHETCRVRTLITKELRRMWAPFSSWVFFLLNIRQPRIDYLKRSFFYTVEASCGTVKLTHRISQATFLNELKIKLSRQSFNYTGMWMLRPLWLVVPHDLVEQDTWMTSWETCFLCFVQNGARFWKCLWIYLPLKQVKASKLFSTITKWIHCDAPFGTPGFSSLLPDKLTPSCWLLKETMTS